MKLSTLIFRLVTAASGMLALTAFADKHVAVIGTAEPEYTRQKYEGDAPRTETYVVMQGKYFDGITADRSIEKMTFRRIIDSLAHELARQRYLPAQGPLDADLLLIVHWGTTVPRFSSDEMRGILTIDPANKAESDMEAITAESLQAGTSPGLGPLLTTDYLSFGGETGRQNRLAELDRATDLLDLDLQAGSNARLLGYTNELRRMRNSIFSTETEATLRADLNSERYFIIIKAYDMHEKIEPGRRPKAVWTLHLNTRSPGQNFFTALDKMGDVAVDFFGRSTDGVQTARPTLRTGTVKLGPLVIIGETPEKVRPPDADKARK